MKYNKYIFKADYINIHNNEGRKRNICYVLNKPSIYKKRNMVWNFKLPLFITLRGTIKKSKRKLVLDSIRSSFGIDLTKMDLKQYKLENNNDFIDYKKENLKEEIDEIRKDIKETKNKEEIKSLFLKLKKKTYEYETLMNKNITLLKYEARRDSLNLYNLEKYVASFLLITGQVVYNESSKKYVYNYLGNCGDSSKNDEGMFTTVTEYKSYNKKEPFNQLIFSYLYDIPAKFRNKFRDNLWSLKQGIKNEKSLSDKSKKVKEKIFVKTSLQFNKLYSRVILNKLLKISKVLKNEDIEEILVSLYEFKTSLLNKDKEDKKEQLINVMSNWINVFSLCLREDLDKATFKKKVKKVFADKSFKLIYKNIFKFRGLFSNYFVTKKSFNDFKDFVENNYITNKKVKEDYVAKTYFEEKVKEYENKIIELLNQIKKK